MLVSCSYQKTVNEKKLNLNGCQGGDSRDAALWLSQEQNALLPESCQPYLAQNSLSDGKACNDGDTTNASRICYDLKGDGTKVPADLSKVDKVWVDSYATIGTWFIQVRTPEQLAKNATKLDEEENQKIKDNTLAMKQALQNGPLVCGINATGTFMDVIGSGTYYNPTTPGTIDHIISIVGYGVDAQGAEFWKVRNSWGEPYGYNGFVNVSAGLGTLGLESQCNSLVVNTSKLLSDPTPKVMNGSESVKSRLMKKTNKKMTGFASKMLNLFYSYTRP